MADERIRVLLVDDHAVVRQGLRMFLGLDAELDQVGAGKADFVQTGHDRMLPPGQNALTVTRGTVCCGQPLQPGIFVRCEDGWNSNREYTDQWAWVCCHLRRSRRL